MEIIVNMKTRSFNKEEKQNSSFYQLPQYQGLFIFDMKNKHTYKNLLKYSDYS